MFQVLSTTWRANQIIVRRLRARLVSCWKQSVLVSGGKVAANVARKVLFGSEGTTEVFVKLSTIPLYLLAFHHTRPAM